MKSIFSSTSIFALAAFAAGASNVAAETFLIYNNTGPSASWSEPDTWRTGSYGTPAVTEYYPGYVDGTVDKTDATVVFPGGNNTNGLSIYVDKNVTIGKIGNEYGMFNVTLNMSEQIDNGITYDDSSITIKATDAAATSYEFINVGSGLTPSETRTTASLTMHSGTVNLTGLTDSAAFGKIVVTNLNSGADSYVPVILTFDETSTLNSQSNLRVSGTTNSAILAKNVNATLNLNGITNIRENTGTEEAPVWKYKTFEVQGASAAKANALTLNIGGALNTGDFVQYANNTTNLSGTLTAYAEATGTNASAPFKLSGGIFNIKNGGLLQTAASTLADNTTVWINGDSTLNVENGGKIITNAKFKTNDWSASGKSIVNVEKGASVVANSFWIGANSEINIAGNFSAQKKTATFYVYQNSSVVNVKSGATIESGYINLAYSKLVVEKGVEKGAWNLNDGNTIKLDNKKATLILYSSDVFRSTFGDQGTVYIEAALGDMYLEIHADQKFKSFKFSNNTTRPTENVFTSELHVTIGEDVNLISMATLANNTLSNAGLDPSICPKYLIFDKFKSGVIHVDSIDTTIDLSLISSIDGEWTNFRFDENNYLIADLIPEPATFAAVFGALALGLATIRRRRK